MSDFEKDILMREVDDEVRRERLQHFWKTFGSYVVGASVLIILATVGIVGWKSYENSRQANLTSQLLAAQHAEMENRPQEVEETLKSVIAANDNTLSPIAAIRLREFYLRQGKFNEAEGVSVASIAHDGADTFDWFARMLGADTKKLSELNTASNPFRATTRELLAARYLKEKNYKEAANLLQAIRDDAQTPNTMKERAEMLLSTIPESEIDIKTAN